MEKKVVSDKNSLFVNVETVCHDLRVAPESDEYLKVWIKEPTWLQVEKALSTVLKIDANTQSLDIDLNEMYRFMIENFIEKTEPHLSAVDMLRLNAYVGSQLKEILPNPLEDVMGADEGN